jgi:ATP-binding cassette subfamily F protein 3
VTRQTNGIDVIKIDDLSIFLGGREIFSHVTLTLNPGQKVGLVGANGSGKTTLIKLLQGALVPDHGQIDMPGDWVVATASQEMPQGAQPIIEFVMDGDARLRDLQRQIASLEAASDVAQQGETLSRLHEALHSAGGYTARARAGELLHGLGFEPNLVENPIDHFSGGWRVRLNLAKALFCPSDLLLLDEPTNHLDLEAILWLENWINRYPHTLLVISHDRDFLDNTVKHIIHIEHKAAAMYRGNYSDFERQRAERLAQHSALYVRQQKEIAHLHQFVERFRAKASKAKQAQDRMKKLERIERIAPAHVDSAFKFDFKTPGRAPNPVIQLDQVEFAYPGHATPQIKTDRLVLRPGDRVGLLGYNGAGKTTLIRILAGELSPCSGERFVPDQLAVGYFAQNQVDQLDDRASPYLHLHRLKPQVASQSILNFLGGFGFDGIRANEAVAPFSGGEKARLLLAMLVWMEPYLLLLDEPTNHLDLDMRHALTMALQEFSGAVILVSHDRFLLSSTVDEFWLVHQGSVAPFSGDLEEYASWLVEQRRAKKLQCANSEESDSTSGVNKKEVRREEAQKRERANPLRKQVKALEKSISDKQSALVVLEEKLNHAEMYEASRRDQLQALLTEQAKLRQEIEASEMEWLELHEAIEQIIQPDQSNLA